MVKALMIQITTIFIVTKTINCMFILFRKNKQINQKDQRILIFC